MCETYGIWERRAPLSPEHVGSLVSEGTRVIVQPSTRRIFADAQYAAAGAELSTDLSPATIIMGVKQVPTEKVMRDKTYVFFSHTIKAQPENMVSHPLVTAAVDRIIPPP